ncbi:phage virion morphogenesis protein [Dyella sp. 2RAB6]|uniref:phage virion morphogenesis protein n=1 Tax=Dyella sp. 2RAB6 TaxID=3232992 RepID=UPI003F932088
MTDNLTMLEDWAGALLLKLAPQGRRKVAKAIADALRRSQQQRIASQREPDGTPFVPRKRPKDLRGKRGRIKRDAMFTKLRTATYLKARATAEGASVEFNGRVGRIATVHQYGELDRVSAYGPRMRYPRRTLLGFAPDDRLLVRNLLITHLSR